MQGIKGVWRRFLGFLEGGADEEEWYDDDHEINDFDISEYRDYPGHPEGLELGGMERRDRGRKKAGNVLDFDAMRDVSEQIIVKVLRPKEIQDATLICKHLQNKVICIIDMQGVERPCAQRIADYLGGVNYALRGQIERIDNYTFVMAPEGAKIDSDLKEELKSGGLFKSVK